MKRLIIIAIAALCIIPAGAFSHPGKTDWRGGHKCIKDCEEWGLFYAEYHLHDKDWKPIRISKKEKEIPKDSEFQSAASVTAVPEPAAVAPKTETETVYRSVTNVHEENVFASNPLLWVLLILLLLLLILSRMNRKREES